MVNGGNRKSAQITSDGFGFFDADRTQFRAYKLGG
jgi:hypothetical protein